MSRKGGLNIIVVPSSKRAQTRILLFSSKFNFCILFWKPTGVMTNYPCKKYSKAEIIKNIKRILNRILMRKGSRSMQVVLTFFVITKIFFFTVCQVFQLFSILHYTF